MRILVVLVALGLAVAARAGTPSPDDWRDQSVYQIFTDRFFDGDPSNNAVEGFYDPANGARIHGGDWAGIEQKLDYVQALGATAIWISPAQKNAFAAYHGYHIQDFYAFAEHFGGLADLRSMIDAAHARGIYVILDVVTNHGGDLIDSADPGYPAFVDPGTYTLRWRNPSNRAAPPFDNLAFWHNNGEIGNYVDPEQILGELFGLDDFRTEDPGVRQALIDAHTWLVGQTDADGFRIDTVKHVELGFWQSFGPQLRTFAADSLGKSSFFQFGEVFDGDPAKNGIYTGTMGGGAFALDSVLGFPLHFVARSVFRDGAPTQWLSYVLADSIYYDPAARGRLLTFLDNHDVGRFEGFGSGADRDDARTRMALAWSHTSLGIPLVYYGTEQEFDGGGDPYNREDMWDGQWDFGPSEGDNFDMSSPMFRTLRRLNGLRQQFPALRRGSQRDVAGNGSGAGFYAFYRELPGAETALVVVNTAESPGTLTIDPDLPAGPAWDALTGRSLTIPASGTMGLVVGGLSTVILTTEEPAPAPALLGTWPTHDGTLGALDAEVRVTFTQDMDTASVESALSIEPPASHAVRWSGRTMILAPAAGWANGTRYTVSVEASAASADGTPLGAAFSFFFDTDSSAGPITVPAGFTAYVLPGDDLRTPLSLEPGQGAMAAGRLFLGDTGWDRVFLWHDRGFVEARFVSEAIGRPSSLAQDRPGGLFGGDLLLADTNTLRRCRMDGLAGGAVEAVAALPSSGLDWIVIVDPTGRFQGRAYLGRTASGDVLFADADGATGVFATVPGAVAGLAFAPDGPFGGDLYVADGAGTVWRIDPAASVGAFATSSLLNGAMALAFDPVGTFGGNLHAARSDGTIVQVTAAGSVSTFATGFTSFPGGDCLAFDSLGDLHAVADVGGTSTVVKVVPISTVVSVPDVPTPAAPDLLSIGPNPFADFTRIELAVPAGGARVRLAIHDIAGREVRVVEEGEKSGGTWPLVWDGRDAAGRRLASGIYFAVLRIGEREFTRKLVLLR